MSQSGSDQHATEPHALLPEEMAETVVIEQQAHGAGSVGSETEVSLAEFAPCATPSCCSALWLCRTCGAVHCCLPLIESTA